MQRHSVSLLCSDIIKVSEAGWQTPLYKGMLGNNMAQIAASAPL